MLASKLQTGIRFCGLERAVALRFQKRAEQLHVEWVVFDDQDAFAAGRPPSIALTERDVVLNFAAAPAGLIRGPGAYTSGRPPSGRHHFGTQVVHLRRSKSRHPTF